MAEMLPRIISPLLATIIVLLSARAHAFETTYWVWHRDTPLASGEIEVLKAQDVRALLWHAGTLKAEKDAWRLENLQLPPRKPDPLAIIPVLRFSTEGEAPLGDPAVQAVSQILRETAHQAGATEVQIDFDCPDRRLGEYATFLARCRAHIAPTRLSATALAGWSHSPAFQQLQAGVDALLPMFYDLLPDPPERVRAGQVLPLIDASVLATALASWKACRIPWHAGLANFARVTLFDREGRSKGHLREWNWDEVCFNRELVLNGEPAPGVTLFRAENRTLLANTPVGAGMGVACRWSDPAHLIQAVESARQAGAAGIALFRLPGNGVQGGWSLRQIGTFLRDKTPGTPEFRLRRTAHGLELLNVSAADLAPRLARPGGPRDRGWELEIESSEGAIFREASPGEFVAVFGHVEPDSPAPKRVPVSLAQRLTWWFGDLRAGQTRRSGLFECTRDSRAPLRWRIPHSPKNSQWQPLDP